jgi:ABC-type iron transport system FetAB ATPase subunit
MKMYRLFDLCIESELPLCGPLDCAAAIPDWTVNLLAGAGADTRFEWFHSWQTADGEVSMTVARQNSCYVLGFPGLARFTIDFDARQVGALPLGECTRETLAHLLLDQVLPRAVCHLGRMVVHASAVTLPDGGAIAFTGVSGRGKSTLAAAFYRAGYRLLSDDCLLLENRAGTVYAVPAYPTMRLWADSAEQLFPAEAEDDLRISRMAHYTSKNVIRPPDSPATAAALPLRALYLLDSPAPDKEVHIRQSGGMAAIMALVEGQFALDVVDKNAIRRGFSAVRDVAGHVPLLRLTYPRNYHGLSQLINRIVERS